MLASTFDSADVMELFLDQEGVDPNRGETDDSDDGGESDDGNDENDDSDDSDDDDSSDSDSGSSKSSYYGYFETPLTNAVVNGSVRIIKLLLARPEVNVNVRGNLRLHLLENRSDSVAMIKLLLARHDVNVSKRERSQPGNTTAKSCTLGLSRCGGRTVSVDSIEPNLGEGTFPDKTALTLAARELVQLKATNTSDFDADKFAKFAKIVELLLASPAVRVDFDDPDIKSCISVAQLLDMTRSSNCFWKKAEIQILSEKERKTRLRCPMGQC